MNIRPQCIIFSAERYTNTPYQNARATWLATKRLQSHDILFKIVRGVYRGNSEKSILAVLSEPDDTQKVRELAASFNQESILCLDSNRHATLDYLNGQVEDLGKFTKVSETEAKQHDNYTVDGNNYYICKG